MKSIDISIIICCYRGKETVQKCLMGISNQNYNKSKYEVVIIDDGSIDGSTDIINNFLSINSNNGVNYRYYKKNNEGLSIARNYGIAKSIGEIVTFIDEDAYVEEYFIENIVSRFNNNDNINCLGGEVAILNPEIRFASVFHNSVFRNEMINQKAIIGTNMSYRKDFLIEIDGFQNEFTRRGDEIALFIKGRGKINKYIDPNVKVFHRQPSNRKHYLRTKTDSGYFGAGIIYFKYKGFSLKLLQLLLSHSIFLFSIPLGIICLFFSLKISLLFFSLYTGMFFMNYILRQRLIRPFKLYLKQFSLDFYAMRNILIMIVVGNHYLSYGFIRGVFKFYNMEWKTECLKSFLGNEKS